MLDFVMQQNFDDFVSLPTLRKEGKIFYQQENLASAQDSDIQALKKINYFDEKQYDKKTSYQQRNIIACFRDELMIVISQEKGEIIDEKYKLVRQINPPLEAYNTKKDLKDTGRSYGLLFE
jgi:hypothetical protein